MADLHDLVGTGEEQRVLAGNATGTQAVHAHLARGSACFRAESPVRQVGPRLLTQERIQEQESRSARGITLSRMVGFDALELEAFL